MRELILEILDLLDAIELLTTAARKVAGSALEIVDQVEGVSKALTDAKGQ